MRNKSFDLLYTIPNLDFNNTKIIYFNAIVFQFEDIIKLIATNNKIMMLFVAWTFLVDSMINGFQYIYQLIV